MGSGAFASFVLESTLPVILPEENDEPQNELPLIPLDDNLQNLGRILLFALKKSSCRVCRELELHSSKGYPGAASKDQAGA